MRKSNLCSCGCVGWCSFFNLFSFVAWSLQALMDKVWPSRRHDGTPLDSERAKRAGEDLGFMVVITDILGDWKEFANSWGFPSWSSFYPCFLCSCDRAGMRDVRRAVEMRRDSEYDDHCRKSEIWVPINTREQLDEIRFNLIDDSTRKGLCLNKAAMSTRPRLQKGDRLEPSHSQDFCRGRGTGIQTIRRFIFEDYSGFGRGSSQEPSFFNVFGNFLHGVFHRRFALSSLGYFSSLYYSGLTFTFCFGCVGNLCLSERRPPCRMRCGNQSPTSDLVPSL